MIFYTNYKGTVNVMTESKIKGILEHNENLNKQTTQYLKEALIILLADKDLKSVTITELCNKAGVSRMAFYGNYNSKEALYEEIVCELNKEMVNAVGNPFSCNTDVEWYINFFELMSENAVAVQKLFLADRERYLKALNYVVLYSRRLTTEQKYRRLLWTGGITNITMYWLSVDMKMPVKEIAELCYYSFNAALSDYPTV